MLNSANSHQSTPEHADASIWPDQPPQRVYDILYVVLLCFVHRAQFVYEGGAIGDSANVSYALARTIDPKCSAQYKACEDIALYKVSCE